MIDKDILNIEVRGLFGGYRFVTRHENYSLCVTTVPCSYVSRSTFRTCPSFPSMTSLTFYDLPPLTHAYDFHMLTISHVYDFHMLTVFTCFSFTYFVRLPCTI